MSRPLVLSALLAVLSVGCGEPPASPQVQQSSPTNNGAGEVQASEPDLSNVLAELTQALRRFSAEKQAVPQSLEALVAGGYLQRLPQAPPGKAFVIDAKNVRVIVR
jgi:hypothetical protein